MQRTLGPKEPPRLQGNARSTCARSCPTQLGNLEWRFPEGSPFWGAPFIIAIIYWSLYSRRHVDGNSEAAKPPDLASRTTRLTLRIPRPDPKIRMSGFTSLGLCWLMQKQHIQVYLGFCQDDPFPNTYPDITVS